MLPTEFTNVYAIVNNLYVRFNCDCWASPTYVHGSSRATVVIGDCESAYPVGSLIDGPNNSKALKVHLYYDLLHFTYLEIKNNHAFCVYIRNFSDNLIISTEHAVPQDA